MWGAIGHHWAVELLASGLASGRVAGANLFVGPAHIGKTHVALRYAAALNCDAPEKPCGRCSHCTRIAAGVHPDVTVVEPDGAHIRIAQIRAVQHDLALRPHEGHWRVTIITGMETATEEAQNALLKTLEDPPPHAVLILTAPDTGSVLPTIASRCRVLSFYPVPDDAVSAALVERGLADGERAGEIARLAAGRVGWALEAARKPAMVDQREAAIDSLLDLLHAGHAGRVSAADAYTRKGDDQSGDLRALIGEWQAVWRDVMLVSAGCEDLIGNPRYIDRLKPVADTVGLAGARDAAAGAQSALEYLELNVNPRLTMATMLLGWSYLSPA
jgi:DNA polymerase-3 subunit delta'